MVLDKNSLKIKRPQFSNITLKRTMEDCQYELTENGKNEKIMKEVEKRVLDLEESFYESTDMNFGDRIKLCREKKRLLYSYWKVGNKVEVGQVETYDDITRHKISGKGKLNVENGILLVVYRKRINVNKNVNKKSESEIEEEEQMKLDSHEYNFKN